MMKKLLFLMLMVFVSIGAWATLSVTFSDDNTICYVTTDNEGECNFNGDLPNKMKAASELVLSGKFNANDLTNLGNGGISDNKTKVDYSNAEFASSIQRFNMFRDKLETAILSENTLSFSDDLFNDNKSIKVIKFKEMTATITKNPDNSNTITYTKSGVDADDEYFASALAKFKGETGNVNIIANNPESPTSWDATTQTLTLSSADSDNISAVLSSEGVDAANVKKVIFADGSVWERDTNDPTKGTLTTKQYPDTHASALANAQLPVTTTNAALGKYVSIINGSIVQIQTNGVDNNNVDGGWPGITDAEKTAITNATNVKLVGDFTENSLAAIRNKNTGGITTLDLTDAGWPAGISLLGLYSNVSVLQTLTLPSTTSIPASFATGFTALTTVNMPEGVETIGDKAFSGCTSLSTINWPTSLKEIGTEAITDDIGPFQGCTSLTTVDLSGCTNLTLVGKDAFHDCTGLASINLPTSLITIAGEAFETTGLTSVDLTDCENLKTIDFEAFENNSALTSFTFPKKDHNVIETIGNSAFSCTGLTKIDMQYCTGITTFSSHGGKYMTTTTNEQGETVEVEVEGNVYQTFYNCTGLTKVVLPPNLTEVPDDSGNGLFFGCSNLVTVEFTGTAVYDNNCNQTEASKLRIGDKAFKDIATLDSVKLSNNVTYIGQYSFSQTGIRTIHIPASVELIRDQAFENCDALTIVVFDAIDDCNCGTTEQKAVGKATVIEGGSGSGAFNNSEQITDVYVNTTTPLNCENYAFDAAITWGRGDAAAGFATLHFPKDQLNHYVNTEHFLTNQIMLNPGLFHDWLMDHMEQALNKEPEKGWWEFINAGPMKTNIDEEPTYPDIMLRTFSDNNISYLVPDGLRAYIVNGIQKAKDKNGQETGNYELILQRLYVIPAKTGVILYGHPNGRNLQGKPILSMTPITFAESGQTVTVNGNTYTGGANEGKALCRANWNLLTEADQEYKNYLEPTNGAVELKPYERYNNDPTQPVMYRNFIMSRFKTTKYEGANQAADDANYMGFFRVVKGTYPSGYAYLKLAGDVNEEGKPFPIKDATGKVIADTEYASASGNEILVKEDPEYNHERNIKSGALYDATADGVLGGEMNPRRWWDPTHNPAFTWNETTKSWGLRSNKFAANDVLTIDWEIEEEADGIVKLIIHDETNTAGDYYTLQGVKVINPTKGVYIRNGKKVIVK